MFRCLARGECFEQTRALAPWSLSQPRIPIAQSGPQLIAQGAQLLQACLDLREFLGRQPPHRLTWCAAASVRLEDHG